MAIQVDKFKGILSHNHKIPVASSEPTGSYAGQMYINSGDNTLYIYWGSWQSTGITLTPPTPPAIATGQPIGLLLSLTYTI